MIWNVIKCFENDKEIIVGYSSGKDLNCDGTILYNKISETSRLIKMSESSDEFDTKWLIPKIRMAVREGYICKKIKRIVIG